MIAMIAFVAVLAIPVGIAQAERNSDTEVAMAGAPVQPATTEAPATSAPQPTTTVTPTTAAAPSTPVPTTAPAPAPTAAAPTTTAPKPAPTTTAPATSAPDPVAAQAVAPPPTATAATDTMRSAFEGNVEPVAANAASPTDEAAIARKSKAARKATEPPPPPPPNPLAQLSYGDQQYLSCVRWRESRNNYTVVNSSSGAGGAYQFLQTTWNNTASHMGRYDLIGVRPNWAAPIDQDAVAVHLIQWYGRSPWAGPGC